MGTSQLPGRLRVVPAGDRESGFQSGLGGAELVLRQKWDEGDRLVLGWVGDSSQFGQGKRGWEPLVSETLVLPQLFPRVKAQRSKV